MFQSILGGMLGAMTAAPPKYTRAQLEAWADAAAKEHGIDPALFRRLVAAESGWNPGSKSGVGAMGLTQLMPGTAAGLGVKNAWDPQENLRGGAKYLSRQIKTYKGDLRKALAAYNAGPGNVNKYGGVPPFKETQNYVSKILNGYTPARNGSLPAQPASTNPLDDAIKNVTGPVQPAAQPQEQPPVNPLFTIASANPTGDMWGGIQQGPTEEQTAIQSAIDEIESEIKRRQGERQLKGQAYADALGRSAPDAPLPDPNMGMDKNASLAAGLGSALLGMFGMRPQSIAAAAQGFTGARGRKAQGDYAQARSRYEQDLANREAEVKRLGTEYDIAGQGISDLERQRSVKDKQLFDVNNREDRQKEARIKSLEAVIYSPKAKKEDRLGALSQYRYLGGVVDPWLLTAANSDGDTVTTNRARTQIAHGELELKQSAQKFAEGKWKDQVRVWDDRIANDAAKWKAGIDQANKRLAESARQHNENLDYKNRALKQAGVQAALDDKAKIVKEMEKTYAALDLDLSAAETAFKNMGAQIAVLESKIKNNKDGVGITADRKRLEKLREEADGLNVEIVKLTSKAESLDKTIRQAKEAMATERPPEHPTG